MERYANATEFAAPITLTSAVDASVTTWPVSAAAPTSLHGGQFRVRCGNELALVTAGQDTTSWTVTRGVEGSTAASHSSGATVKHLLTAAALQAAAALPPIANACMLGDVGQRTYPLGVSGATGGTNNNNMLVTAPVIFERNASIKFGVRVGAAGSSGAVVRLGLWDDDAVLSQPNALLYESAALSAEATGDLLSAAVSVNAGVRYWMGHVTQGSPTTLPSLAASTLASMVRTPALDFQNPADGFGWRQDGVSGAMPDPMVPNVAYFCAMLIVEQQ